MPLPNTSNPLGAGRKIGATGVSAAQAAKASALVEAPVVALQAPSTPKPAIRLEPALGGSQAQAVTDRHPLLLGVYPAHAPTGETAEQGYKLTGTSPTVAKNAYPFDILKPGQTLYLVADPYGETVKTSKVSMPGDDLSGHPDPTAISVQDAPAHGRHVGYIPKASAAALSNVFGEHPTTRLWPTVHSLNIDRDGIARGVNLQVLFQEGDAA